MQEAELRLRIERTLDPEADEDDDAQTELVARLPGPAGWRESALALAPRQEEDELLREEYADDTVYVLCRDANPVARAWTRHRFDTRDGTQFYYLYKEEAGSPTTRLFTRDPALGRASAVDEAEFAAAGLGEPDSSGAIAPLCWKVTRAQLRARFPSLASRMPPEEDYYGAFLASCSQGGRTVLVPLRFWYAEAQKAASPPVAVANQE